MCANMRLSTGITCHTKHCGKPKTAPNGKYIWQVHVIYLVRVISRHRPCHQGKKAVKPNYSPRGAHNGNVRDSVRAWGRLNLPRYAQASPVARRSMCDSNMGELVQPDEDNIEWEITRQTMNGLHAVYTRDVQYKMKLGEDARCTEG